MPHIHIEYNPASEDAVDIAVLVEAIHSCAMTLDALPVGGLRTRAYRADCALVGDAAPDNAFIYVTVRLGQGRLEDVKRGIGDALFGVLTDMTAGQFAAGKPISLGLEIQEIEKDWTWKKNNIHQIITDKHNG